MRRLAVVVSMLWCCGSTAAGGPPDLAQLTAAVRARIDGFADRTPLETAPQQRIDFAGDLIAWVISQAVLTTAQETSRSAKAHAAVVGRAKVGATPQAVTELFQRLVLALPPHLNPPGLTWKLTTLDAPEVNAFTVGGGYVYAHKPLLDAMMAEPDRGAGALAFVLAHEIGHVVLGHCRRGYQRERIEKEIRAGLDPKIDNKLLRKILQTSIHPAGKLVEFLYSREQDYEADLFALHLCRNAEIDLDHALDALRWVVALQYPKVISDPDFVPVEVVASDSRIVSYFLSSHPRPLRRLRRLRMELAGAVPDEARFGLFAWDPGSGALSKAGDRAVGPGVRALVLVHGVGGDEGTFSGLLERLHAETLAQPVLKVRYPNDGSLAHAAALLKREMARVVETPGRAVFVAHSAGGLVCRAYAEKLGGRFDQMVFLGTPHRGTNLVAAKFLLDLTGFVRALRLGLPDAVAKTIREGRGQIAEDLHPNSLFLRWLGNGPKSADRYHTHAGQFLSLGERVGLKAGMILARKAARKLVADRIQTPWIREAMSARIDAMRLGEEITRGDFAVSTASATAVGSSPKIWKRTHHLSILLHDEVVKELLALLKEH